MDDKRNEETMIRIGHAIALTLYFMSFLCALSLIYDPKEIGLLRVGITAFITGFIFHCLTGFGIDIK